jgi:hypothetical protein
MRAAGFVRGAVLASALAGTGFSLACAWVKPTDESNKVELATRSEIASCDKVATTTVSVLAKVGIVDRSEKKVAEELTALARNEAATRGADAVLPVGAPEEGRQSFELYRCASD